MLASKELERIEVIPATYEWTTEIIEVSTESSKVVTTPAVYGTESEQILVQDARTYWNRTFSSKITMASDSLAVFAKDHGADIDSATVGMCFHEHTVPATFSTKQETILVSEESEIVKALDVSVKYTKAPQKYAYISSFKNIQNVLYFHVVNKINVGWESCVFTIFYTLITHYPQCFSYF